MACLYFGDADECQNCGGSASLGNTQEALRTHIGVYCGDECFDEAIEAHARWER